MKKENDLLKKTNIMGVNINVINMENALNYIQDNLEELRGNYICISNVHTTVMSYEDSHYKNIQNSSIMTLPDGAPLAVISKMRGNSEVERITGPDFMEEVFKISIKKGYNHFFYGSTLDTLNKLQENLLLKYPELNIVGTYSPPFRELTYEENIEIEKCINDCKPDFIWVGLGAPKQEVWMYNHKNSFKGIMIGVGAGFDYHAGNIKRAPKIMQRLCLEWLYRLIQNPKRLFKRYLHTNSKFILIILKLKFKL